MFTRLSRKFTSASRKTIFLIHFAVSLCYGLFAICFKHIASGILLKLFVTESRSVKCIASVFKDTVLLRCRKIKTLKLT